MGRPNIFYLENNLMADWYALKKTTRRELAHLYSDAIQPSEEPAPLVLIWVWREVFERNTKVIKTWTKLLTLLDQVSEALDRSASYEYEAITNEEALFIDLLQVVKLIHRGENQTPQAQSERGQNPRTVRFWLVLIGSL